MKNTQPKPLKKTPRAKSVYDQAIYQEAKDLLPHGYFTLIAPRYRLSSQEVRRIMLGFYNENNGTHKAIREEILAAVASRRAAKMNEIKRIGLTI